jgi:hypothetical protein
MKPYEAKSMPGKPSNESETSNRENPAVESTNGDLIFATVAASGPRDVSFWM